MRWGCSRKRLGVRLSPRWQARQTLRSYRDCLQTDNTKRIAFARELLRSGILTNPGEKLYFSLAHTDEDVGEILSRARTALKTVQERPEEN